MGRGERPWEGLLLLVAAGLFLAGYGPPRLGGDGFEPGARDTDLLRVVTWNVGGSGGRGGRALDNDHLEHVAETLGSLDPDLCFLQEVASSRQLGRLLAELGDGWTGLATRSGTRRVAALARRGTLERLEIPTEGRTLAVAYRPGNGAPVAAIGLHADAFSSDRRNAQVGAAAVGLGERPEARILAGDLNLDLDLDKRRDLFTDDEYRDVETYNFVAGSLRDAASGRGSTAEPDRRLDYVFVQPDRFVVRAAGPWKGRRLGDMDHDPVVADLARRP